MRSLPVSLGLGLVLLAIQAQSQTPPALFFNKMPTGLPTPGVAGLFSSGMAVADFNQDGKPDIIEFSVHVAAGGPPVVTYPLALALGNGDGTFTPGPTPVIAAKDLSAIATGDFNGDGKPDLLVSSEADQAIYVALGNGDGTFQPPLRTFVSNATSVFTPVQVADFNGDGKLDVLIGPLILFGQGNGSFTVGNVDLRIGRQAMIVDVNGDGSPDVVSETPSPLSSSDPIMLNVLVNNGSGSFNPAPSIALPAEWKDIAVLASGDLNGDGHLDLVAMETANLFTSYGASVLWHVSTARTAVFLGNGEGSFLLGNPAGTFQSPILFTASTPGYLQSLRLIDMNGDGKLDLLIADEDGFSVLLGKGDGTFGQRTDFGVDSTFGVYPTEHYAIDRFGQDSRPLHAADFNGDGKPDVLLPDGSNLSLYVGAAVPPIYVIENPNVTPPQPGSPGYAAPYGAGTVVWNAPGTDSTEVFVGSAMGTLFTGSSGPGGAQPVTQWLLPTLSFFLLDSSTGATLGSTTGYSALAVGHQADSSHIGLPAFLWVAPAQPAPGSYLATTTIGWQADPALYPNLEIRVETPTGKLLGNDLQYAGTATVGPWIVDGLQFFLVDSSSGSVIAQASATVSASAPTAQIVPSRDPILAPVLAPGQVTMFWIAPVPVQIRFDAPNGTLWGIAPATGFSTTGVWIFRGTTLYLQDATAPDPTSPQATLATYTFQDEYN